MVAAASTGLDANRWSASAPLVSAPRASAPLSITSSPAVYHPNRWSCVFLSPELRICRLPDGSRRTYAKVEAAMAEEEVARLAKLAVAVDPAAIADWETTEALNKAIAAAEAKKKPKGPINPMEDPNDDRPMYIKREAWENMNGQGRGFGGGVGKDKFGPISG